MRNLTVFCILCVLFFNESHGMISVEPFSKNKPVNHIVTLTRVPTTDSCCSFLSNEMYFPISASEAATVFAIVNFF